MRLLAVLLLVSGCADFAGEATPPPPETVKATFESRPHPDTFRTSFEGPQRAAIEAAASEWCNASNRTKCPRLADVGESVLEIVEALPLERGGEWYPIGDVYSGVRILSSLDLGTAYLVALHEFGHHFGCGDVDDGSIMTWKLSRIETPYITEKELNCK